MTLQSDGRLCCWDTATGRQLRRFDLTVGLLDKDWTGERRWSAALSANPRRFKVWDAFWKKLQWEFSDPNDVTDWAFDQPCHNLAAIIMEVVTEIKPAPFKGNPRQIHILEVQTGKVRRVIPDPVKFMNTLSFSPDGRLLVAEDEGHLRMWSVETGEQLCDWQAHATSLRSLKFTRHGKHLITFGSDSTILLWDIATLTKNHKPKPPPKLSAADLVQCWADLSHNDASIAFDAMCKLTAAPDKTLPLLEANIKPVPHLDSKQIEPLAERPGQRAAMPCVRRRVRHWKACMNRSKRRSRRR